MFEQTSSSNYTLLIILGVIIFAVLLWMISAPSSSGVSPATPTVPTTPSVASNFSYSDESSFPSQFLSSTGTKYGVICSDASGNIVDSTTIKTDLKDVEISGDLEVKGDFKASNIGMKQIYIYNGDYKETGTCPSNGVTWYTDIGYESKNEPTPYKSRGSDTFTVGRGSKLIQIHYSLFVKKSDIDIYSDKNDANTNVYFEIRKPDGSDVTTCPKLFNSGFINTYGAHTSFSISRVLTNAQLPAGTYKLTAYMNDTNIVRVDCNDYCQATLIEVPERS